MTFQSGFILELPKLEGPTTWDHGRVWKSDCWMCKPVLRFDWTLSAAGAL